MKLKHFKNFTSYQPNGDRFFELVGHFYPEQETQNDIDNRIFGGIQFLQSADGEDWYLTQNEFSTDTVKIQYNAMGIVTAITTDISGLWPFDCSVVEFSASSIPENAQADGKWQYSNGVISLGVESA
ncbi:TPA: tail fiber assembly protein [Citrobacter freundii]|uniref:tail fiber assembly protein n=1 Tax=Citrobacter TaxID=544 RepID=UPI00065A2D92|nr:MULTISPECIES: tail fiber assembly protein [Citrobacter]KLV46064.1 hypothetical protein SK31_01829 [Citrobacter sp. MGH99]MDE8798536.1 tail fiber assembly protein [Citrobacter freundii]MDE8803634.1 tail fiber assembly protein [Citrobacter freundii]